jgi:hypothetical protein
MNSLTHKIALPPSPLLKTWHPVAGLKLRPGGKIVSNLVYAHERKKQEKSKGTFQNGVLIGPGRLLRSGCSWWVFRSSNWEEIIILTINYIPMLTMSNTLNNHNNI